MVRSLEAMPMGYLQDILAPEGYQTSKSGQLPHWSDVSGLALHLSCHLAAGGLRGSSYVDFCIDYCKDSQGGITPNSALLRAIVPDLNPSK